MYTIAIVCIVVVVYTDTSEGVSLDCNHGLLGLFKHSRFFMIGWVLYMVVCVCVCTTHTHITYHTDVDTHTYTGTVSHSVSVHFDS